MRGQLREVVRAGEWWEHKLVPIFAAFYATAIVLDVPISTMWRAALTILLSLIPGAAYVSVINDLTDRDDDLAAGKTNRTIGRSRVTIALLIAATVAAGIVFAWLWRNDTLLLTCYLAAWLAFSLYSLPPFRFKCRGLAGVLCDASGAHLFPTLVAVILAFRAAARGISIPWIVSVGVWAFAYGLRGILWHQLTDVDNDRSAGVRTFAQRHPPHVASRLGTFVAFPLELIAFGAMLWRLQSAWPLLFLAIYAFMSARRMRNWKMAAAIVAPKPHFFIVLHEYYNVLFPVSLLIASAIRFPMDGIALLAHLLLFPARATQTAIDFWKLLPRLRYQR